MKKLINLSVLALAASMAFSPMAGAQYKQTISNATIILHNREVGKLETLPLTNLDKRKIAVVTPSEIKYNAFIEQLGRYAEIASFDFSKYDEQTKYYNTIIIAVQHTDLNPMISQLVRQSAMNGKDVVLCVFQESSSGVYSGGLRFGGTVTELFYPSFTIEAQKKSAMSVFGGLAVTAGKVKTQQTRIQYTSGEGSGLNLAKMGKKIDAIAAEAIREKAAPGMVVMAIKDGQVIFDKAYGSHTYENKVATKTSDIFDLASISKIAGTTPVIMHLQEQKAIHLDSTLGTYLYQAKATNKANTTLRTVLLHEGGFTPFIPFYKNLKKGDLLREPTQTHQVKVADSAYLRNHYYRDVMWPEMLNSAIKNPGSYVYSDISMYALKEVAEHVTAVPLDDYIAKILYKPIGMKTAGYNPRTRFAKSQIVPTEHDTSFRKVLLEGYVHDQGAAMAGGVAGHAGLFSTANDLAIYGQLLLNRGAYGGVRYFKPETIDLFTSKQSKTSRRGLGFDRFDAKPDADYPSRLANSSVYGHTGYTGTCIWIDPKHQLVYIFLSNRVHPQVSTKLLSLNIRSRIQDAIYETINEAK